MTQSEYIHESYNVSNLLYHFVATVGRNANEEIIAKYVREQGKEDSGEYRQLSFFGKV